MEEFAKQLAPGVPRFCPTGPFHDGEGFTFFKRNKDFSIPKNELIKLAGDYVGSECFSSFAVSDSLIGLGYSSGAVFATALLAVAPGSFAGAILLRPQVIADDFVFPTLSRKPVLIISGLNDARRQPHHTTALAEQLMDAGATVTLQRLEAGHVLTRDDLNASRAWLNQTLEPHLAD
jgi:phospholipase/carboxylesterase